MRDRTAPTGPATEDRPSDAGRGAGVILVALYAVLALAATGRSVVQLTESFDEAPLAYLLSAVAAVIYCVATVAIARHGALSRRVAIIACSIELVGVLVVGAASYAVPEAFPHKTVWSHFGSGYGYVPLVLPVLGLWWLSRRAVAVTTD